VATCGVSVSAVTRAGLSATNVAPQTNLQAIFQRFRDDYTHIFPGPDNTKGPGETVFTVIGDEMLDGVMAIVRAWRPDVIIYTPFASAAPIAATKHKIPSVFLGIAIAYTPEVLFHSTYSRMTRSCERHCVGDIQAPSFWIDVAPTSLRGTSTDGVCMRPISCTGATLVDAANLNVSCRPQIAVTLGSVIPVAEGLTSLRWLVTAAPTIKAEFVIALGRPDAEGLGELPPNVHASTWISFERLIPGSAAVIHHGGPGTMFAALDAGLPQLVVPRASDQFYNAKALRRRGVALVPEEPELGSEALSQLLTDHGLRRAAQEVGKEMRCMPAPADVARQVIGLAT
jgi:Protein of unknown function (DUF1205)